jgi:hypothetical protein
MGAMASGADHADGAAEKSVAVEGEAKRKWDLGITPIKE